VRGPFARSSVLKQFVFRSMWCRCARAAIEIDVKFRSRIDLDLKLAAKPERPERPRVPGAFMRGRVDRP